MSAADNDRAITPDDVTGNSEHAYNALRQKILRGELAPGLSLSQVQLAEELGISRTPLREAVRRLQSEGLLRSEHNRRVRVSPLSTGDFEDLYAIRISLDSLAAQLTVPALTEDELVEMRQLHDAQTEALLHENIAAYHEPHKRFHYALYRHAGRRLVDHVQDLWDHADRYRLLYQGHAGDRALLIRLASADHAAILAAAEQRDAIGCARLVGAHLARTALMTLVHIDHRHDPARVRAALELISADEPGEIKVGSAAVPDDVTMLGYRRDPTDETDSSR